MSTLLLVSKEKAVFFITLQPTIRFILIAREKTLSINFGGVFFISKKQTKIQKSNASYVK